MYNSFLYDQKWQEYFSYPSILGIFVVCERTGASICPAMNATVQLPHIFLV